jgi:hypothetical protein
MQVVGFLRSTEAGYRHFRPMNPFVFVYFLLAIRYQEYVSCSLTA